MENVFSNTFFQIFKLRKVRCKLIVATIVFSTWTSYTSQPLIFCVILRTLHEGNNTSFVTFSVSFKPISEMTAGSEF